jgi:hypothetical protein
MGAWGSAIFSDDTACDVRDYFRELLEDGYEGDEATRLVLDRFKDLPHDSDDGAVFWLALAATQWRFGRLHDDVKTRAIEIIDASIGLDGWEEAGASALKARRKVLDKLRSQLTSPQPRPRKVRRPRRYQTELSIGDAISYRLNSGKFVILRVVGIEETRYWSTPIFELCDWVGDVPPPARVIQRLPFIVEEGDVVDTYQRTIVPHKKGAYPAEKITIIARDLRVRKVTESHYYCSWVYMDQWLNHTADHLRTKPRVFLTRPHRLLKI